MLSQSISWPRCFSADVAGVAVFTKIVCWCQCLWSAWPQNIRFFTTLLIYDLEHPFEWKTSSWTRQIVKLNWSELAEASRPIASIRCPHYHCAGPCHHYPWPPHWVLILVVTLTSIFSSMCNRSFTPTWCNPCDHESKSIDENLAGRWERDYVWVRDEESYMYMSPFTKWPQQLGSPETIGMSVRMGGRWEDRMGSGY